MDWLLPGGAAAPDSGMGHFHVSVQVSHRAGGRFEPLEALVDTGATYSWIPRGVLEGLGIVPEDQWPFVLADGREVLYPVAWINIRMRDRVQPTIVVFGDPGSEPILGVVTLEEFRVAADPVNRRLISVPGRLKQILRAWGAQDAVGELCLLGGAERTPWRGRRSGSGRGSNRCTTSRSSSIRCPD